MRRELRQKILLLKVNFLSLFKDKKSNKNVAILSSKKWQNKVTDDILLRQELLKNNINAKIIAWDEQHNYKDFDLVIVRSIWGYEKDIFNFEKFLNRLSQNNNRVLNDISIMKNNYDKEKQFSLLEKYKIPHIKTIFIPKNSKDIISVVQKNLNGEMILKPSMSASGNNTYLINSREDRKNTLSLEEINDKFGCINELTSLMLQPFIKEIDEGEISLIYIGGKFSHAIKRFPSVFNNKKGISYISNIDKELLTLGEKVLKIKEYQGALYERIDVVKINDEYLIMELELVEPALFIKEVFDKKTRKDILENLVKAIKEKMEELK